METLMNRIVRRLFLLAALVVLAGGVFSGARAQFLDQGAIDGVVQDPTGAVIPGAQVVLTNPDTGFKMSTTSNGSGVYVFSPVKIGTYTITVKAQGFESTIQKNVPVNLGQRAGVNVTLKPGSVGAEVTVTSAPPLLQTQDSSTGETFSSRAINDTPLNSRNVIYLAQLTAGTTPSKGSRANGSGDFDANGMRAEQNNFVLDGVDNNAVSADFLGGASYVINPPPDALQQFKVSTSNYSAEYGHSAGALVSASVKSGTNNVHGDVWEYFRNDFLDAGDWTHPGQRNPEYRQNLYGATLGLPIIKDKLFFFGDTQNNRVVIAVAQNPITVPTALERTGDFSELLTPANTGGSVPIQLYEPQNNQVKLTCPARATTANPTGNNVLCYNQIDSVAQNILNMYPLPNSTAYDLDFDNYSYSLRQPQYTFQWDARLDYNPTAKDQAFFRFSFLNQRGANQAPLGPVLDGGGGNGSLNVSGTQINYGNNFVLSETHTFSPRVVNELRYAFNYSHYAILNPGYNIPGEAASLGLGGVPQGPTAPLNGGLPTTTISGGGSIAPFGAHAYRPELEYADEYQILDNVSWTLGNHSLRLGASYQSIRGDVLEPPSSHPAYTFNGSQTARPGVSNTGSGIADFLTDNMSNGSISPSGAYNDAQFILAGYVEDDWRARRNLTLNVGVRYEYFQPYKEMVGKQANFFVNSVGVSTGSAVYELPAQDQNTVTLNPAFLTALAKDNIALQYTNNVRLTSVSPTNFAPRVGFAYTAQPTTVVRGGFGLFYQGQQNAGVAENMATNYPFNFSDSFPSPSCTTGSASCANNGYNLETGFSSLISQGLTSAFSTPGLTGQSLNLKTTYAMDYNVAVEQAFTSDFVFTLSFVGTQARHLPVGLNSNSTAVLLPAGTSTQNYLPFPAFGASANLLYIGISQYDSLQTKLEKRITRGLDFTGTYTWSHALDDAANPLGNSISYRDPNIIPIREDETNSAIDTRHRVTFNGFYRLPFGRGQAHMSHGNAVLDGALGGWSTNLTFQAQTGNPMTITTANQTNVAGGSAYAVLMRNPYAPGGSPDPTNLSLGTCPTSVHNRAHWYNPCAFANPLPASMLSQYQANSLSPTTEAVGKLFLGGRSDQIYGPGFRKLDMSLFKHFPTVKEQYLELRADCFNLTNTPLLAQPSTLNIGASGGQITGARQLQLLTPNGRFFQVSAKYVF